jgi:hypothetical protein
VIVFNLICKICNSGFEGWFDSSVDFEKQKKRNIINCPVCNSSSIKKSLMAPNISKKSNSKLDKNQKRAIANNVKKLKKEIEKNFDYVGDNFTEEAKKIKYGEAEDRSIYGEANLEQTKELLEEEINIMPLPWESNKKNN